MCHLVLCSVAVRRHRSDAWHGSHPRRQIFRMFNKLVLTGGQPYRLIEELLVCWMIWKKNWLIILIYEVLLLRLPSRFCGNVLLGIAKTVIDRATTTEKIKNLRTGLREKIHHTAAHTLYWHCVYRVPDYTQNSKTNNPFTTYGKHSICYAYVICIRYEHK